MNDNIYKTPEADVIDNSVPAKPSAGLRIACYCLAALLVLVGATQQFLVTGGRVPETMGGAIGGVIWPLLVVLIFQVGKRFRNQRSRYRIFTWTALFFFISILLSFISLIASFAQAK